VQIEKVFDVACCLADGPLRTSYSSDELELRHRDYVLCFLSLILTLRGGQTRYFPPLLAKFSEILLNLPLPGL
jgi:hypothetical protein